MIRFQADWSVPKPCDRTTILSPLPTTLTLRISSRMVPDDTPPAAAAAVPSAMPTISALLSSLMIDLGLRK